MSRQLTVQINTLGIKGLTFSHTEVINCIEYIQTLDEYALQSGELSIVFLNNERITELHQTYLQDATPTDVITFKGDPEMEFAGEICINIEQAASVHQTQNTSISEEITLYLVHGFLHLAGFDDKTTAEQTRMRMAEKDLMQRLKNTNLRPQFDFSANPSENKLCS